MIPKHPVESLLLALLHANIPVVRLVSVLKLAGFSFNNKEIVSSTGDGNERYAAHKVKSAMGSRIAMAQTLFAHLRSEYERLFMERSGETLWRLHPSPLSGESERSFAHRKRAWLADEARRQYLAALEVALVDAVKCGDSEVYYRAVKTT